MQNYRSINDCNLTLTEDQERMRRNLRYHFMNPKEKWQAKGTLPIKMILIIIKLIVLTVQVIIFSEYNSNEVSFIEGTKTSFKHLFLSTWGSGFETLPYPPSSGPFAIYKVDEFYSFASYALENYYKIEDEAIGPYGFGENGLPNMTLDIYYYKLGNISFSNSTYQFSSEIHKSQIELKPFFNGTHLSYDVKSYLDSMNFSINFNGLLKANLKFSLRSIQLKSFEVDPTPDCFQFDIIIEIDNGKHNGQVQVDLLLNIKELPCHGKDSNKSKDTTMIGIVKMVDILGLIFSCTSLYLCCRSMFRLHMFWKKTKLFFQEEMEFDIKNKRKYFISTSYILIFFGDVLIITGIILKINEFWDVSRKGIASFTVCTFFLGIGVFLGYLTLLRYFSYFPKSSILINTIKASTPPLLRFSFCSVILYLAFSLLGWIILGPYHLKFRTFVSSISCLFSLMNGDDMYVTLSIINVGNPVIFVFSQLYIYIFCILFIFVVLNLILTIIIEAYNQVKYENSPSSTSDVFWNFINSCPESSKSPLYKSDLMYDQSMRRERGVNCSRFFVDKFCCCIGKGGHVSEIKPDHGSDSDDEQLASNFFRSVEITTDHVEDLNQHLFNRNDSRVHYGSVYHENRKSPRITAERNQQSASRDLACSL